jgi:hypothetical protein
MGKITLDNVNNYDFSFLAEENDLDIEKALIRGNTYHYEDKTDNELKSIFENYDDKKVFTKELNTKLKEYRDLRVKDVVSFRGVEAINDPDTANKMHQIIKMLEIKNDPEFTIGWKGPNQWHEVTLSTFKGLFVQGGLWEQKVWAAYEYVIKRHENTAYKNWESAKADFDERLA